MRIFQSALNHCAVRNIYGAVHNNSRLVAISTSEKRYMATMASAASVLGSAQAQAYHPPRPRKFAPLNVDKAETSSNLPRLRGVIFDVDGTLCLPQNYMFKEMRAALQIPKSVDILDHIRSLSDKPDQGLSDSSPQSRASDAIKKIESTAMTKQTPQPGLVELMTYLESRQIHKGLCTRNFPAPVQHLIDKFLAPHGVNFVQEEIVTREARGIQPKPSPEGIWSIAKYWTANHQGNLSDHVQVQEDGADESDELNIARKYLGSGLIMVGDSIDDMAAGYRAGAATVLLVNEDNEALTDHEYTDLAIRRLDKLIEVLEKGFVGKVSM